LNWVCQAPAPPIVDILYFATAAHDKIVDPIHGSRQFFVAKLRAQDRYELILMQAFLPVRAALRLLPSSDPAVVDAIWRGEALGTLLWALQLAELPGYDQPFDTDEVAAAVAFLAAEESSYVTGETLGVSGGLGMV